MALGLGFDVENERDILTNEMTIIFQIHVTLIYPLIQTSSVSFRLFYILKKKHILQVK